MRVLHVINSLATGGAEKLILETLPRYNELGITADLLLLNGSSHPFLEELKQLACCEIYVLGHSSPYQFKLIWKLIPYFRKYDLIHAHLFPATYFSVLAKKLSFSKTPLIFTEHNTSNRRFRNTMFRWFNSRIYPFFDRIICITDEVKKEVLQKTQLSESKLTVINNGVDILKISKAIALARASIHPTLGEEDFVLLQVSSFRKQKDQQTVIRALLLLPEKVKLLLAGEGALKNNCEDLVKSLDLSHRVFFVGNRNDIPQLLQTSDINLLSSVYEGLSLASIEGMAAGKPFIASDVPGLSNVVGGAGILFPKGDAKKLADEIRCLMTDQRYYNSIAAQCKNLAANYDIQRMVDQHLRLYAALIRHP